MERCVNYLTRVVLTWMLVAITVAAILLFLNERIAAWTHH